MNTDWSSLGDYVKEPTTGRDDESGEQRYSQDLAVFVHKQEDALEWLDNSWQT